MASLIEDIKEEVRLYEKHIKWAKDHKRNIDRYLAERQSEILFNNNDAETLKKMNENED